MSEPTHKNRLVVEHGKYEVTFYWSGTEVSSASRNHLPQEFDKIASTIWGIDEDFFRKVGADLFTDQDRVAVVTAQEKVVGFSISRRIVVGDRVVLFRRYTCMYPAAQGRGIYGILTTPLLTREHKQQNGPLYLAWRTRNPVVWFKNSSLCSRVAPSLADGRSDEDLLDLAWAVCCQIYPQAQVDPATLTVNSVYPGDSGYRTQPTHPNAELDAVFRAHPAIRSPHDALFGIGALRAMSA